MKSTVGPMLSKGSCILFRLTGLTGSQSDLTGSQLSAIYPIGLRKCRGQKCYHSQGEASTGNKKASVLPLLKDFCMTDQMFLS